MPPVAGALVKPVFVEAATLGDPACLIGGGDFDGAPFIFPGVPTTTHIIEAARNGDLDALKLQISRHPDHVNTRNNEGRTALFYIDDSEKRALLLRYKANPEIRDNNGDSFISALPAEVRDEVARLVAAGGYFSFEQQALQECKCGDLRNIAHVRPRTIDICSNWATPVTALDIAVRQNNIEMFDHLKRTRIHHDTTLLEAYGRAFCLAVELGHAQFLEEKRTFIVGSTPPFRFDNGTTLHHRALQLWDGNLETPSGRTVAALFSDGWLSEEDIFIAHTAAHTGDWDTAIRATKVGLPFWYPDAPDQNSIFHYANEQRPSEAEVEILLATAATSEQQPYGVRRETILHQENDQQLIPAAHACLVGNVGAAEALIRSGTDIEWRNTERSLAEYVAHLASKVELEAAPPATISQAQSLFREVLHRLEERGDDVLRGTLETLNATIDAYPEGVRAIVTNKAQILEQRTKATTDCAHLRVAAGQAITSRIQWMQRSKD